MIKNYLILLMILFFLITPTYAQSSNVNSIDGLIIDPAIKTEAEKYMSDGEFRDLQSVWLIYKNRMFVDIFESDNLTITTNDKEISQVFKSFYYWRGDTLNIDGAFGLSGGFGFNIQVVKDKAILYHMLASDEFPSYSYSENGNLIFRLEVPCTDTKIILSELPEAAKNQLIYGYVEFKSGEYFSSEGKIDGKEIKPRRKSRANMKMYFKSAKSDL